MSRSITIGRLSAATGVNIETIQYYEKIGLLVPPRRTAGNYRAYEPEHLDACAAALTAKGLADNIMVDCSHANSSKDHERQPLVARAVMDAVEAGNRAVMGLMLESHLEAGRQDLKGGREALRYGVSVTDACIDWGTTETLVRDLAERAAGLTRPAGQQQLAG